MKTLLFIAMILTAVQGMARQKKTVNVDSLSEKERTEYLTKVAEQAVKRFARGTTGR